MAPLPAAAVADLERDGHPVVGGVPGQVGQEDEDGHRAAQPGPGRAELPAQLRGRAATRRRSAGARSAAVYLERSASPTATPAVIQPRPRARATSQVAAA